MSEDLKTHEANELPVETTPEQTVQERLPEQPETTAHEARLDKEEILKKVEQAESDTTNTEHIKQTLESQEVSAAPQPANKDLKRMMFQRTLTRIQKRLPVTQRLLSKVINQPVIDRLSNAGEKTIARPLGILWGGIFALVGSSIFLYFDKSHGYTYNHLLFVIFFVGGFVIGLLLELLLSLFKGHKLQKP